MDDELAGAYTLPVGVSLNMIINESIDFTGDDGSSRSISNDLDKRMLIHLRKQADIVITDAATAARESYKPSALVQVEVWSKTGDFRGLQASVGNDTIKQFSLVVPSTPAIRLAEVMQTHSKVLLETGPTLTKQLGRLNLIDHSFLTIVGLSHDADIKGIAAKFCAKLSLEDLHLAGLNTFQGTAFVQLTR